MPYGSLIFGGIRIALYLLIFLVMAIRYERLAPINARVRAFVMQHRRAWLDPIMHATHVMNGAVSMSALTGLIALLLGLRWGNWRHAFIMTMAMVFETAVSHATKAIHKSERPPQRVADILMKTHSYPSGHTAASMTFALVVPYFLQFHVAPYFWIPVAVLLILNALLTAYGRLYLDMHWLADLLGGWCMAAITFAATRMLVGFI